MLSVRQIQQWISQQMHEDETDTVLTTLLLRWIDEGFQEVASAENWKWLEEQEAFTLGTHGAGANTSVGVTYFPDRVSRLLSVWPAGRNYREQVEIIGGWELDALDPSMISGSPADWIAVYGYYNVARDNPTAGVIACADAGGATLNVKIEGVDTNGLWAEETVTIAGGGPTNSTTQFALGPGGVRSCYIVEDTSTITGTPTVVTFSSGGTVIETLNYTNGEYIKEHLRTELSPAPAAGGASYNVRYLRKEQPVTSTADVVRIPREFENLLFYAIGRRLAAFRNEMDKAMVYEQMFRQRIKELKAWQNRQPGRMRGQRRLIRTTSRWPY